MTYLLLFMFGMLFSICNACTTCSTPWKNVYEHDDTGNAVSGDVNDLIDAHNRGARIRYMIRGLGAAGFVEELEFSLIFNSTLCGESVTHVCKDRWDHLMDNGAWRFIIVCTDGIYETFKYLLGEPTFVNSTLSHVGIVWFVLESACPTSVYHHLANGTAISGSKDELKQAVLSGFDVKFSVDIDQYMIPCHSVEISENGQEVVGQTIWTVNTPENGGAQWWFQMPSSNGYIDTQVWTVGEHHSQDHSNYMDDLAWMVEPCWRHVYTHDEAGVEQRGSLASLIAAVEQGQRVKIVIGDFSMEADNVRTHNGHVSAQLLSQVGKNGTFNLLNDNYWVWQIAHTTGTVRTRRYSVGEETNRGDTVSVHTISWFVDTRKWMNVFSTIGFCGHGTQAVLKKAVEKGASVRVGLELGKGESYSSSSSSSSSEDVYASGWFFIKAEQLEFGPSGEVAAELIKSVSTELFCETEFKIQDSPFWRFMVVTSEGNVDISQWRVGVHIDDGHYTEKANIKWFVSY